MGFLDELKDKAGALGDKAKGTFDEVKDKAADVIEEVKDKAGDVVHEVKDKAEDVVHDVREKFDRHGDEGGSGAESGDAATGEGETQATSAAAGESMDTGKEDPGFADQPEGEAGAVPEDTDYLQETTADLQETPADTTDTVTDAGTSTEGTDYLQEPPADTTDTASGGAADPVGDLGDAGSPGAAGMTEPGADVVYSTTTPADTETDTFQQPAAATTEDAPGFSSGVASFEDSEGLGAADERPAEDRSSEDPGRQ